MKNGRNIKRFDIWYVSLDPTIGKEIAKSRPCVVISPNEMNKYLDTVIVAPITHTIKSYPSRLLCNMKEEKGEIVIDQIRAVDKIRFIKKVGTLNEMNAILLLDKLQEIFSY